MKKRTEPYQNKAEKPYLHLVDGGLTDNLGFWQACWICRIYSLSKIVYRAEELQFTQYCRGKRQCSK